MYAPTQLPVVWTKWALEEAKGKKGRMGGGPGVRIVQENGCVENIELSDFVGFCFL